MAKKSKHDKGAGSTPATVQLEKAGVEFHVYEYEHSNDHMDDGYGVEAVSYTHLEGVRVGDGDLSQSATIQLDAGEMQALNEAVVGDALSADGSVDALDPQLAEIALASLAVAEVVVKGVQQLFLGLAVQAGALATVAGSPLENNATLLVLSLIHI